MNKLRLVFTLAICCMAMLQVSAQKVGYVNSQEIIALMPDVQEAKSNLETYGTQLEKRAQQMYQALEAKSCDFTSKARGWRYLTKTA